VQQTSADETYACHKLLEALPSTSPEHGFAALCLQWSAFFILVPDASALVVCVEEFITPNTDSASPGHISASNSGAAEFDQGVSADIGTISFDGATEPNGCQASRYERGA